MKHSNSGADIPMGLGMALSQNHDAMNRFSSLSQQEQQQIIEQTHSIRSKEEMRSFVSSLGQSSF